MKKKIKISMICLMLVATFFALTSLNNIYAAGETKDITFEDENMYNAIKEKLADKISSSNDSTKTISMSEENINSVTRLTLTEKGITNISGIENFTKLTILELWKNQISDISALSSLTNLEHLNLWNNQISDISALSNLTNLTWLLLSDNQISDISALSNLTNLTWMYLVNNKVSDISSLSSLTNLTTLSLYTNQISDISALKDLTKLTFLSLAANQIGDVSPLKELTNLTELYLSNNKISDISALKDLTKLTKLYLGGNQISDISALSGFTDLIELKLYNNKIDDITLLDNELNKVETWINEQSLTMISDGKNVELPKIFLQAKDPNSKAYTENEFVLENCTLNADGKSVTINNGVNHASVKISGGAADGTILDIEALKLEVSKTTEELTNQNVGVTIRSDKALKPLKGWVLSDDKLTLTKEYERNTTESVKVTAEDGSTAIADISITNIDKDAPVIEYTINENEDGSLEVILIANEKIRKVEGWVLSDDCMKLSKTYTEPTEELVEIYDLAGNKTDVKVEVKFKDNKLEEEEIVQEENNENPKTGDNSIYLALLILGAGIVSTMTLVYKKN